MATHRQRLGLSRGVFDAHFEDKMSMKSYLTYSEKFCEPRSFGKLQAWIAENYKKKAASLHSEEKGTFLDELRREASSPSYSFYPSPEFKPGKTFVLPPRESTHNYQEERMDRCVGSYTYLKPDKQLCKDRMRRKIFCEVLGDDVCLDCNGRKVRSRFNTKVNALYPYLEYHDVKRPYGYCPRAVRLTEPLPSRDHTRGFPVSYRYEPKKYEWLRTNSDSFPKPRHDFGEVVIRTRSYTG